MHERVPVCAVRPAVNLEHRGDPVPRGGAGWLHHPPLDRPPVGPRAFEPLGCRKRHPVQHGGVPSREAAQRPRHGITQIGDGDLAGRQGVAFHTGQAAPATDAIWVRPPSRRS